MTCGEKTGRDCKKNCLSVGTMQIYENKEICTLLGYERRQENGDEVLLDRRSEEGSLSPYPVKALQVPQEEVGHGTQSPDRRQWRGQPLLTSGARKGDRKGQLPLERATSRFQSDHCQESMLETAGIKVVLLSVIGMPVVCLSHTLISLPLQRQRNCSTYGRSAGLMAGIPGRVSNCDVL